MNMPLATPIAQPEPLGAHGPRRLRHQRSMHSPPVVRIRLNEGRPRPVRHRRSLSAIPLLSERSKARSRSRRTSEPTEITYPTTRPTRPAQTCTGCRASLGRAGIGPGLVARLRCGGQCANGPENRARGALGFRRKEQSMRVRRAACLRVKSDSDVPRRCRAVLRVGDVVAPGGGPRVSSFCCAAGGS